MVSAFRGYNHTAAVGDDEFCDMQNMTSSLYPVASTRDARARLRIFDKPNGLIAREHLCWVDGTGFYYNGSLRGTVTDTEKQLVSMGAYVLIFPDKKRFHTDTLAFDDLEASWEVLSGTTIEYRLCKPDGSTYGTYTASDTAPAEPVDGQLWMDTSGVPHALKQYAASSAAWTTILSTYVCIEADNIGALFAAGDGVTISGTPDGAFDGSRPLQAAGKDYIVVTGTLDGALSQTTTDEDTVTIARTVPDMDFVVELNNRLWGCSSLKNEIYACKLGDPRNWYVYQGVSTDSYAVTISTDGDFTGAASHLGYALFFKDAYIHRIYGTAPSSFQVSTVQAQGVQGGSGQSIVAIDGILYYKSRDGVCAYDGGFPVSVSAALGTVKYSSAVAGSIDSKYYVSMMDAQDAWHLFVFDTQKGLWHREDDTQVSWFAREGGELYFLKASDKALWTVHGTTDTYIVPDDVLVETDTPWYAETGDIGAYTPDRKYVSKLQLRLEADAGAEIEVEAKYDGAGYVDQRVHGGSARAPDVSRADPAPPVRPHAAQDQRHRSVPPVRADAHDGRRERDLMAVFDIQPLTPAAKTAMTAAQGQKEIQALQSYVYQLTEQLRHTLSNLDTENLTPAYGETLARTKTVAEASDALSKVLAQGVQANSGAARANSAAVQRAYDDLQGAITEAATEITDSYTTLIRDTGKSLEASITETNTMVADNAGSAHRDVEHHHGHRPGNGHDIRGE